jgi:hypothetical protein
MTRGIYERTPEHRDVMSKAKKGVPHTTPAQIFADETKRGVPLSPEHCAAIVRGIEKSDNVKAHNENMYGGNDLVDHHYIYDESDLSLNTVKMKRSDHTSLHRLLQILEYMVPHINR